MDLKNQIPLSFTQNEFNLLISHLDKDRVLLEYGCGISAITFSSRVKYLHSIEHDRKWFNKIKNKAEECKINNLSLYLVEPDIKDHHLAKSEIDSEFVNTKYGFKVFNTYINFQKNINFDDIFIDGRARLFCAEIAYFLLNNDGLIFFHDFGNRLYYHPCLRKFKIIDSADSLFILKKF